MVQVLDIKCPSCGTLLTVRNSKNEAVKQIECPQCKKHLAINFREDFKPVEKLAVGFLSFGEATYPLHEGLQTIGCKHPNSTADIQIATGDPLLSNNHAIIKVVKLTSGGYKHILSTSQPENRVLLNQSPLQVGDEVVLRNNDTLQLGNTVIVLHA